MNIITVELPKFMEVYKTIEDVSTDENKDNALLQWLYLLTKGYESKEEMDMVEARTAGVANFNAMYRRANADDWVEMEVFGKEHEGFLRNYLYSQWDPLP